MANDLKRMGEIIELLLKEYPDSKCSLNYENPFQLLVATILSAQCTDERVNRVTGPMFKKFKHAKDYDRMPLSELKKWIFSTGFYNNKAKSIKALSKIICTKYNHAIPNSIDELVELPGVGRKTANVVLGTYYGIPSIVVDTHVTRLTNLLKFCKTKNAVKIEKRLNKIIDEKHWIKFTHLIIDHGRKICIANRPKCNECVLIDLCPSGIK